MLWRHFEVIFSSRFRLLFSYLSGSTTHWQEPNALIQICLQYRQLRVSNVCPATRPVVGRLTKTWCPLEWIPSQKVSTQCKSILRSMAPNRVENETGSFSAPAQSTMYNLFFQEKEPYKMRRGNGESLSESRAALCWPSTRLALSLHLSSVGLLFHLFFILLFLFYNHLSSSCRTAPPAFFSSCFSTLCANYYPLWPSTRQSM